MLTFQNLSYGTQAGKTLIDDVSLTIMAGEMLAIMGPSGAGKSTLLDLMSFRKPHQPTSSVTLNGERLNARAIFNVSCFVEQEDALLGVLTVRETITYALRLHQPLMSNQSINSRVDQVIRSLGLRSCASQRIGTPIQRGISGGQKRRVTAACALVTFPRILFLDEVTSGLDSTAAREVMLAIRHLAIKEGIYVIATIHQPSQATLATFTNTLLLARGQVCYTGSPDRLPQFFEHWGRPVPRFANPVEHAMNYLNEDFAPLSSEFEGDLDTQSILADVEDFRNFYVQYTNGSQHDLEKKKESLQTFVTDTDSFRGTPMQRLLWNTLVLSERSAINYIRNILAYGVRLGMYIGMGVMIATIWVQLGLGDSTINDRLSVHFYSVAFLAFMSVAGIPSFLEERSVFYTERKNGLYTTLPFVLANTFVNIPFLFLCTLFFTVIIYWAIPLHPGASEFFRYLAFLTLAILAAEAQSGVVAAIIPIFVAALAIAAFMNGFWMSVGGYFIKARSLPRFWYYSFHFMDYQRYAFELLTTSDLIGLDFTCEQSADGGCICAYPSSTPDTCTVSGQDVLDYLDIGGISSGKWTWILVSIIVIYRIALYVVLRLRSK